MSIIKESSFDAVKVSGMSNVEYDIVKGFSIRKNHNLNRFEIFVIKSSIVKYFGDFEMIVRTANDMGDNLTIV